MSFEKFWQWKGLSPCEIKWRSPINRAAICFFLLVTYCTTIHVTFSINARTFTIEQIGPKLGGESSWVTQKGARKQSLKPNQSKSSTVFWNQRNNSLLRALSPVPGKPMNSWGPEPDPSSAPIDETHYSQEERLNICVSSFVRLSDTAVGKKFKEARIKQTWFPWMLLNKTLRWRTNFYYWQMASWLVCIHCVSVLDRLNVSNIKADIHTAEEEILQETPRNKAAVDNTSLKEKGSKNSTLLKRILAPIHSLKVTFITKSKATSGLDLGSVLSADIWNLFKKGNILVPFMLVILLLCMTFKATK